VRFAEEAQVAALDVVLDQLSDHCRFETPHPGDRSTCSRAYSGEMSGSRPEPEAVTASAGTSDGSTSSRSATACLRSVTEASRSGFSGPRLDAPEASGS